MSQLPLDFLPPVTLESSWSEILDAKAADMPADVRRRRWEQWKSLAARGKHGREAIGYWTDTEACAGCRHLDGDWCRLQELPVTVNPVLTLRGGGMIGMACMGAGWEDADGNQRKEEEDGFPFWAA